MPRDSTKILSIFNSYDKFIKKLIEWEQLSRNYSELDKYLSKISSIAKIYFQIGQNEEENEEQMRIRTENPSENWISQNSHAAC